MPKKLRPSLLVVLIVGLNSVGCGGSSEPQESAKRSDIEKYVAENPLVEDASEAPLDDGN